MRYQLFAILILTAFYAVYIGKLLWQRQKGIQTDQIAKGDKGRALFLTELVMKIAAYGIVVIQLASIILGTGRSLPSPIRIAGFCLGLAGVVLFGVSVWTMHDSWRAGIPQNDKTDMVTTGIYRCSRNPAFVGFDLMYLGLLCLCFNWVLLVFTAFAMVMLHLQILQEEAYLTAVFGEEYTRYRRQVRRYLGRMANSGSFWHKMNP